jgi:hypothetical protein
MHAKVVGTSCASLGAVVGLLSVVVPDREKASWPTQPDGASQWKALYVEVFVHESGTARLRVDDPLHGRPNSVQS